MKVYSKGKSASVSSSLNTKIRTQPINQSLLQKRPSLMVVQIDVLSKKNRPESAKRKLSLINKRQPVQSTRMREESEQVSKIKDSEITQESKTLVQKPSIINLLYEDDQELQEERRQNQAKYNLKTFNLTEELGRKIFTEGNADAKIDLIQKSGLSLTSKTKNIFNFSKNQFDFNMTRPNRPVNAQKIKGNA